MNETTNGKQSIYPALRYDDARAAIDWLKSVLGCTEHVVYADDGNVIHHAELELAGNLFMLGSVKNDGSGNPAQTVYVALDSREAVDATYARVAAAKAAIVRELTDTDYGSHEFGVRDPGNHNWSFGTYKPQAGSAPH
jgi:uncharacterized glyoxalase superfamily protein PhnB